MADHRVPLGGSGWSLWREAALRSAGFPARRIEALCDDALAVAADRVAPDDPASAGYESAFAAAVAGLSAAIADIAGDPRFREAVAWQNPAVVTHHLDHAVRDRPPAGRDTAHITRNKRGRKDELAIASYVQRYCLKNETIGFFGPVGWARVSRSGPALSVTPGPGLLARRTTYFEVWTIDELAHMITQMPGMLPWLTPRAGVPVTLMPLDQRPRLSAAEEELLRGCDGKRTVADLVGSDPDVVSALQRLVRIGAVRIELSGTMQAWPEQELAQRLETIGDPDLRARAEASLAELLRGRDAVAAAAGDADKVRAAIGALDETFERLTGSAARRRNGGAYAGRTLLYEDCVRDVDVRVGPPLLDALAGPLGPVLDSVQWLVGTIADRLARRFKQLFEEERAAAHGDPVPLMRLFARVGPELTEDPSGAVAATVAEFQKRWRDALNLPSGVRRHAVKNDDIVAKVARLFPPLPARWSKARQHSVDIMIAAPDVEAVNRGDFKLVLSQLHATANALDGRAFVEQHEDPARLVAADEADHGDRRVYAIPPRYVGNLSSRVSPPAALLSARHTYVSLGTESVVPPGSARTVMAADLHVDRRGRQLVVRDPTDGREFDFLEVIGEILSGPVRRLFQPMAPAPHTPRVTIDRLVLWRESWTFAAAGIAWAGVKNEQKRYALARQWRREHQLPERVFARIPSEVKPTAVDFRSLVLVNLLAKAVRTTATDTDGAITISEMLPDLDNLWLTDAEGHRYSSELRFVAVSEG